MTHQDLCLVVGLVLVAFAVPAIFGAIADRRRPRVATVLVVAGGGLILYALNRQTYALTDIPAAFVRVLAYFVR